MGSFSSIRALIQGAQIRQFAVPHATGGGADGSDGGVTIYIEKINGEIITTILVALKDLLVSGTVKDIIGEDGVAAAYLTRVVAAKNGVVYKIEMGCIEVPAGTSTTADIDLVANNASLAEDVEYDDSGAAIALIAAGGNWTKGMYKVSAVDTNWTALNADYLYLANGSGANSGGTYTAGKFIIKLYGANF